MPKRRHRETYCKRSRCLGISPEKCATLEAENKQIKKQFDILSEMAITQEPEMWEAYLKALKGK